MRMATVSSLIALTLLAGCQSAPPVSVVDGSGFEMLTPSPATRKFIVANDLPFARQVVAHNETCARQPGCRKGE